MADMNINKKIAENSTEISQKLPDFQSPSNRQELQSLLSLMEAQ